MSFRMRITVAAGLLGLFVMDHQATMAGPVVRPAVVTRMVASPTPAASVPVTSVPVTTVPVTAVGWRHRAYAYPYRPYVAYRPYPYVVAPAYPYYGGAYAPYGTFYRGPVIYGGFYGRYPGRYHW